MLKVFEYKIAWRPTGMKLVKDKETGQMVPKMGFQRVGPRVELADCPAPLKPGQKVYLKLASGKLEESTAHGTRFGRTSRFVDHATEKDEHGKPVRVKVVYYGVTSPTQPIKDKCGNIVHHNEIPVCQNVVRRGGERGSSSWSLRQFQKAYETNGSLVEEVLFYFEQAEIEEAAKKAG